MLKELYLQGLTTKHCVRFKWEITFLSLQMRIHRYSRSETTQNLGTIQEIYSVSSINEKDTYTY